MYFWLNEKNIIKKKKIMKKRKYLYSPVCIYFKTSAYKWIHVVQTHIVQGLAVLLYSEVEHFLNSWYTLPNCHPEPARPPPAVQYRKAQALEEHLDRCQALPQALGGDYLI